MLESAGRSDILPCLACLAAICALQPILRWYSQRRARPPLPPGPPGKLLVGNVADMPAGLEWETFTRWGETYGDVVHVKVFSQHLIYLNSWETCYDLFEKRSTLYSDRFDQPMIADLMGWHWHFAFMNYGPWWRRHRKVFHQKFHPTAARAYLPVQTRQTRAFLRRVLADPEGHIAHLRHLSGAIIMEIIYGIKVADDKDPYLEVAEFAVDGMARAGNAGAYLVDTLPILKHVPEWLPGATFKRQARAWCAATTEMVAAPFDAVKRAMASGDFKPSFVSELLEELPTGPSDERAAAEKVIRGAGGGAFAAGSDTTAAALHTFLLAIILYPEVPKKAQAELDAVVGPGRLPSFDDRAYLPYVDAVVKEVLRWRPVTPLAVPHRAMEEDEYRGYRIPAGSVVTGNSWALLHDPQVYGADADEFNPDRFFRPGVRAPTPAFGFGRRTCPGRFMADNSVYIAIASILAVFDVTPAPGAPPVEGRYTSGLIVRPEPFQCSIKPRSKEAEMLVLKSGED